MFQRISIFGNQKNVSQFLVLLPTLICIVSQLLLLIPSSSAYKILVYSQTLTRSHIILNARVAEALAADGHNVTILEVEYLEPLVEFSGSTAKGVRKISVGGREQLEEARAVVSKAIVTDSFVGQTLWTVLKSIPQNIEFQEMLNGMCETFLDEQAQLLEQLRAEKFDLFIGEQINFCGSALSKVMDIPVHVLLVSCPIQEHVASLLGLPFPSSFVPSIYGVPLTDRMSMAERFANLVGILVYGQSFHYGLDHLTGVFRRRFGEQFPAVSQIVSDSPLVFVNVDELVDFPRPIFPHVVYIGGLEFEQSRKKDGAAAAPASKPLNEPFRSQMERGRRGVVFVSLGSAVNTVYLPEQFRRNLFAAIAQLPDWHFLVKVSDDDELSRELATGMANVFLTGWAPQRAILGHPRTRLFVSHGGYNSLLESALAGCPILSMGFFADQMRNALVPERNGWGRSFDKRLLLEGSEQFRGTLVDLLEQPGFQEGAKRLKNLLATKPFTAREKLVRHIRFLELNDGRLPELMPESRRLSTVVLYNLDLCALGLLCLALALALLFLMGRLAWRLCCFRWTRRMRGGGGGKAKEE